MPALDAHAAGRRGHRVALELALELELVVACGARVGVRHVHPGDRRPLEEWQRLDQLDDGRACGLRVRRAHRPAGELERQLGARQVLEDVAQALVVEPQQRRRRALFLRLRHHRRVLGWPRGRSTGRVDGREVAQQPRRPRLDRTYEHEWRIRARKCRADAPRGPDRRLGATLGLPSVGLGLVLDLHVARLGRGRRGRRRGRRHVVGRRRGGLGEDAQERAHPLLLVAPVAPVLAAAVLKRGGVCGVVHIGGRRAPTRGFDERPHLGGVARANRRNARKWLLTRAIVAQVALLWQLKGKAEALEAEHRHKGPFLRPFAALLPVFAPRASVATSDVVVRVGRAQLSHRHVTAREALREQVEAGVHPVGAQQQVGEP